MHESSPTRLAGSGGLGIGKWEANGAVRVSERGEIISPHTHTHRTWSRVGSFSILELLRTATCEQHSITNIWVDLERPCQDWNGPFHDGEGPIHAWRPHFVHERVHHRPEKAHARFYGAHPWPERAHPRFNGAHPRPERGALLKQSWAKNY